MSPAVSEMREVCAPFDIGTLGAFFDQSNTVDAVLIRSDASLVRELISVIDKQLLTVLETRNQSEHQKATEKFFVRYVRGLRALSDTMSNLAPKHEIATAISESIAALTEDLQKQRGLRFGDILTEQAVFALWTLGKIRSVGAEIQAAGEPRNKDADIKLTQEYYFYSLWSQFHLDSLVVAMKYKKSIPEDVQASICDGLRASVNAYSIIKEALALRTPPAETPASPALPWDDEDEKLLASSMRNRNALADDC